MEFLVGAGIAYFLYKVLSDEPKPQPPRNTVEAILPPRQVVALVGMTGSGKSSTGNALIKKPDNFTVDIAHGTTTNIQVADYLSGYKMYDTPGLMDDTDFSSIVWNTSKESELVIYVTRGQLYRQELLFIEKLSTYQASWNKNPSSQVKRRLIIYMNMLDLKEQTMPARMIESELNLLKQQVAKWVSPNNIVSGASAPVHKGAQKKPRIDPLEKLVFGYISKNSE